MNNQQKIYDWCDRRYMQTEEAYGLIVYRGKDRGQLIWTASIKKWSKDFEEWIEIVENLRLGEGNTPEEAIAKLAKALGL